MHFHIKISFVFLFCLLGISNFSNAQGLLCPVVDAGPDTITVCSVAPTVVLKGAATNANRVEWLGGKGEFTPNNTTLEVEYTPKNNEIKNVYLSLTLVGHALLDLCADSDTVVIKFIDPPSVTANGDAAICSNSSQANISGQVQPFNTTAIWTSTGTGSFSPSDDVLAIAYIPSDSDINLGQVTLTLSATNQPAGCEAEHSLPLKINELPIVKAGDDKGVCGRRVNLEGAISVSELVNSWTSTASGTFSDKNSPTSSFTVDVIPSSPVTLTFTTAEQGGCPAVSDDVNIAFTAPAIVSAGADQDICSSTVTLAGTISDPGITGTWTASVGGAFSDLHSKTSTFTPDDVPSGSFTLTFTIPPNGSCNSASDDVIVTITSPATVSAGADQDICSSTVTLAGTISDPGITGTWTASVGGVFSDLHSKTSTFTPNVVPSGPVTLTFTIPPSGGCSSASDDVNVTFTAPATVSAGPDQDVCGSSVTLAGTISAFGIIGTWTASVNGVFSDIHSKTSTFTPDVASSVPITLTFTIPASGSCSSASDDVIVTFTTPATVSAGADQDVCGSAVALAGTISTSGITGTWTASVGGVFSDLHSKTSTFTPNVVPSGPVTLTFTIPPSGGCSSASDDVIVTFTTPATVSAGQDQNVCGSAVTLAGTISASGIIGTWDSSIPGTFSDLHSNVSTFTPNVVPVSPVTLTFTIPAFGSCDAASDAVTITFTSQPTVSLGPDQTVCGSSVSISGISSAPGSWAAVSGGTFASITNPTTTFTATTPPSGPLTLLYSVPASGGCLAASDAVTVTFTSQPTVDLGLDQTICGASVSIAGTSSGVGSWTSSVPGSFSAPTNPTSTFTPTTAPASPVTLTYSVPASGGCLAASDAVTVTFTSQPTVDLGLDQTICGASVSIAGTSSGAGSWTSSVPGSFSAPTNPTSTFTPTTAPASPVTLTYAVPASGGCLAASDAVTVTFTSPPTVDLGLDQTICGASVSIAGTSSGVGSWTSSVPGSFSSPTNPTSTFTPTTAPASPITLTYAVPASGGCLAASDAVTVTFISQPSVDLGLDQTVCGASVSIAGTSSGVGSWTSSVPGSFSAPTNPTSTFTPTAAPASPITLTYAVPASGGCAAVSDNITVTFTSQPAVDLGLDKTVCGTSVSIAGTASGAGSWTSSVPGSFSSPTNPTSTFTPTTAPASPVTLTYAVPASGGCLAASDAVTVTFTSPPTVDLGLDQTICGASVSIAGTSSGVGSWTSSVPGSFSSPTNPTSTFTPTTAPASPITLTYAVPASGVCLAASDAVTVTFTSQPTVDLGLDKTVCGTSVSIAGTASGSGSWTSSVPGSFSSPTNPTSTFTPTTAPASPVTLTYSVPASGGCLAASDAVTVTFTSQPSVDLGLDQTVCGASVSIAGTSSGVGSWTSSVPGSFSAPTNPTSTFTPTAAPASPVTLTYAVPASGGCLAASDAVTVTFTSQPAVDLGLDKTVCGTSVSIAGTASGSGNWTSSVPGSFSAPTNPTSTFTPTSAPAGPVTLTFNISASGACAAVSDQVVVTFTNQSSVDLGPNKTVCASSVALTVTGTGAGQGSWSTTTGGGFSSPTGASSTFTPTTIPASPVKILYTVAASGGCMAIKDSLLVTFTSKPTVDLGTDITACASSVALTATGTGAGQGSWSTTTGGLFSDLTAASTTFTLTTIPASPVKILYIVAASGGCAAVKDSLLVTFTSQPTVDLGVDKTVCASSVALTATGTGVGLGSWSTTTGGSFSSPTGASSTFTPTTIPASPVKILYTVPATGGCLSGRDSIIVTFTASPTVNAGKNKTVCKNISDIALAGSISAGLSAWSSNGTGIFVPNTSALNATYVPSAADKIAGTVTLTLTSISNGSCTANSDALKITFIDNPLVNAGADREVCGNNSIITLAGSVPAGVAGVWSTNGSGKFTPSDSVSNPTYTPGNSDIKNGSAILTLVIKGNSNCNSVSDNLVLTISPAPVVKAGNDITVCKNNPKVQLNGIVSNISGKGQWSTNGSGTFTPDSTALNAQYTPSIDDLTMGSIVFTLKSVETGNCLSASDDMVVTFSNSPVNAGLDQSICLNNAEEISLNGSTVGKNSRGTWSSTGSGKFIPADTVLNAKYKPSKADLQNTTIIFTLTGSNTSTDCSNASADNMIVSFTAAPLVNAGEDILLCANQIATLTGSVTIADGGKWFTSGSGTFKPSDVSLAAQYVPGTSDIQEDSVYLILTSTGNKTCKPVSDSLLVKINKLAQVDAGADQEVCNDVTRIALKGSMKSESGIGQWSSDGSGTFSPSGNVLETSYIPTASDKVAGSVILTLRSVLNGSCAAVEDQVKITFKSNASIDAGIDQSVCWNNPQVNLKGTVSGNPGVQWVSRGDGSFTSDIHSLVTTYLPGPSDLNSGKINILINTLNTDGCANAKDSLTVSIAPAPTAFAGADQRACMNNLSISVSGAVAVAQGGIWTSSGNGTFTPGVNSLSVTYIPGNSDIVNKKATLTLTTTGNGNCKPVSDQMEITLIPAPVVYGGPDKKYCENSNLISLTGTITGNADGSGQWSSSGSGTFANVNSLNTSYVPSQEDKNRNNIDVFLTSLNNGLCNAVTDTVHFNFIPIGTVDAGDDLTICANDRAVSLTGQIGNGPTKGKWTSSGDGIFLPSDSTLNAIYQPGTTDVSKTNINIILTTTNGCSPIADAMNITITPNSVAIAGDNQSVCNTNPNIQLHGKITGPTGGTWESLGTGKFNPSPSSLDAIYVPTLSDISQGKVKLYLSTTGNPKCKPVVDTLVVSFLETPRGSAGDDFQICKTSNAQLNGTSRGGNGKVVWNTSGTGTFSSKGDLKAVYFPSAADIKNRIIQLSLSSSPDEKCGFFSDTLLLFIRQDQGPGVKLLPDKKACSGDEVFLGRAPESGLIYRWFPGQVLSDSTSSNPEVRLTNITGRDTTYSYYLTVRNVSNGCETKDTVNVLVNRKLMAKAGKDTTVCAGQPVLLGNPAETDLVYFWSPQDGLSNTAAAQTIFNTKTVTETTTFTYILELHSGNANCSAKDTVTISVKPGAHPEAGKDRTVCPDIRTVLGAPPEPGNKYSWSPSSGLSSDSIASPSLLPKNDNQTNLLLKYLLSVENAQGCKAIDSVTITVNPKPRPQILQNDSTLFCGQTFAANYAITPSENSHYEWFVKGGNIVGGAGSSTDRPIKINWDNTLLKSLFVVEVDSKGCIDTLFFPLNNDDQEIVIRNVTKQTGDDSRNYLYWNFSKGNNFPDLITIKRRIASEGNIFESISTIGKSDTVFTDANGLDPLKIYEYIFSFTGRCGTQIQSLPHNTIVANTLNGGSGSGIDIFWNAYHNWPSGVSHYEIWRKQDENSFELYKTIDSLTLKFNYPPGETDAVSECFVIKAIEGNKTHTSLSNEICLNYSNIPNAISPNGDGVNDTWIIDNINLFPDNEVTIFNQWNSQVYHKRNYDNKWNGDNLPDGTYYYIFKSGARRIKGYILIMR